MPMSKDFEGRLCSRLPEIVKYFGTLFHIYDEKGIIQFGEQLKRWFSPIDKLCGFQEFFAVKALPNFSILKIMRNLGFGFDCSSFTELHMVRWIDAKPEEIMLTSNNTPVELYYEASKNGGSILNLDDISFISKVPEPFPKLICFRYNPGDRRSGGNQIIGKPREAKYGARHDQIIEAYKQALLRGAERFGIHTMIVTNELDYRYMVGTIEMLLDTVEKISDKLGIKFKFINMGGGMGIPYKPEDKSFNFAALAKEAESLLGRFKEKHGYAPKLYMESGRAMTGPHGVLVTKVINRMDKYRQYVGVDACESALMRPAMYKAYHHMIVVNSDGKLSSLKEEKVDVVSSLCENLKLAEQRMLPRALEGDFIFIQDTGAHGSAMGFQYNGWLKPKELLLREDGCVALIRRAENIEDYLRTMTDFKTTILEP